MKSWRVGVMVLAGLAGAASVAGAAEMHAQMRQVTPSGPGEPRGMVAISDGAGGAVIKTALKGLPPGAHGFHIHQNGSCEPATVDGKTVPAGAAGGHFDPQHTGKHEGPQGNGHLGDLPVLQVAADGTATQALSAPQIKDIASLRGKAVMIHAGGDNYRDQPAPLGGGGARIACGVIE